MTRRHACALVEVLAVIGSNAVLIALLLPVPGQVKEDQWTRHNGP